MLDKNSLLIPKAEVDSVRAIEGGLEIFDVIIDYILCFTNQKIQFALIIDAHDVGQTLSTPPATSFSRVRDLISTLNVVSAKLQRGMKREKDAIYAFNKIQEDMIFVHFPTSMYLYTLFIIARLRMTWLAYRREYAGYSRNTLSVIQDCEYLILIVEQIMNEGDQNTIELYDKLKHQFEMVKKDFEEIVALQKFIIEKISVV